MLKSLLLALGCAAIVAAQSAVSSNTTTYVSPSASDDIVLLSADNNYRFGLIPLTTDAFTILPHSITANQGIEGILYVTNPQTVGNVSSSLISMISCDAAEYPGEITMGDVMGTAAGTLTASGATTGVKAIILYSNSEDYCDLTSPVPNFGLVYSMTSTNNTQRLLKQLEGTYGRKSQLDLAIIVTEVAYSNFNGTLVGATAGTGTAVAMIILYVVTGLITLMFILIIITGAIRAHRHPERYGPRHVFGRPRQSRARGLARAMLETLPIVKFGEHQDLPKHGEVELAEGQAAMAARGNTGNQTIPDGAPRPDGRGRSFDEEKVAAFIHDEPQASDRPTNGIAAAISSAAIPTPIPELDSDAGLVCSICTDDFAAGEDIRVLPCNHKFHPACVDPWLLDVSGTCPLCRVDLRPAADRTSTENDPGEDGALPPPLDPSSTRRRDMVRAIFLNRTPEEMQSRTQRVAALRRFRQANALAPGNERVTNGRAAAGDVAGGEEDSRRRHLLRGLFPRRADTPEVT